MNEVSVLLIVGAAFFLALIGIPIGAKISGKDLTPGWVMEEVTGSRLDALDNRRGADHGDRRAVLIAFLSRMIARLIVVPVMWAVLWALAAVVTGGHPSAIGMLHTAGIVFLQLAVVYFVRALKLWW